MYNTRRSGNNTTGNQYNNVRQQQLPQTMPHVATYVTPTATNQAQALYQNKQQPMQNVGQIIQPRVQTSIPTPDIQFQASNVPNIADSNSMIRNENDQATEDTKVEKTNFKTPKRKINKKEQKKRLNARMRRLVCPKSPLMVFSELYKDIPITLDEMPNETGMSYTASFVVDGQLYVGNHHAKTQAKQRACENFLRILLAKKMNEKPEKKESNANIEMENSENATSKPKGPPQEDFPWPHFASLAMHNLINHWDLQPIAKAIPEEATVKVPPKVGNKKKFPQNPAIYNPVQLLHQMIPGIQFTERTISATNPSLFEVSCEINTVHFKGQGSTKKAAKKECAISAIKHLWNFDFHSVDVK